MLFFKRLSFKCVKDMCFIFVHTDSLLLVPEFDGVSIKVLVKSGSKVYYRCFSHSILNVTDDFSINL